MLQVPLHVRAVHWQEQQRVPGKAPLLLTFLPPPYSLPPPPLSYLYPAANGLIGNASREPQSQVTGKTGVGMFAIA